MLPKRETPRHCAAFEIYAKMPKRSMVKVAKEIGVSRNSVESWARAFHWADRLKKWGEKAILKQEERVTDELSEMKLRQIKLGQFMQAKGARSLQETTRLKPMDAIRAVETGAKLEAVNRGAATEIVDVAIVDRIRGLYKRRDARQA